VHFAYFTERPYRGLSEDEVLRQGAFFGMPNSRFDRALASDDFNYYLDQAQHAEAVGFDGVALNEHHGTPFCMGAVVNMEAAVLARITERAKIYLIGNPIPAETSSMDRPRGRLSTRRLFDRMRRSFYGRGVAIGTERRVRTPPPRGRRSTEQR
jgi:hypothetical protein